MDIVDGADLEPLWRETVRALPGWFTREGRASRDCWELDYGFAAGPVRMRFTGGGIAVDEPGPWKADHRIEADAVEDWSLPYDLGATAAERSDIRAKIDAGQSPPTTYGDPLYPYGAGLQGW